MLLVGDPNLNPSCATIASWDMGQLKVQPWWIQFLCDVFLGGGGGGIRQFAGDSEKKNDKDSTKTTKNGRFFGEGVSPPRKNLEFVRLPAVHM